MKPHKHDIILDAGCGRGMLAALRRKFPQAEVTDIRPLPAFVNAALKHLAALELSASRHVSLPFGTSVIAVARKHG